MSMELVHFSDCGGFRSTNQDAYCIRIARGPAGLFALLAVCDGMGGLKHGEVASAAAVSAFETWFDVQLPLLLQNGFSAQALRTGWETLLQDVHGRICRYARDNRLRTGTTVSAVLLTAGQYYLMQVGDSRIYLDDLSAGSAAQVTVDQTLAMRELLAGRITAAQFAGDSRRSILLQCVGDRSVAPVFQTGELPERGACLVCSDGFCHFLTPEGLHEVLGCPPGRAALQQGLVGLGNTARSLGERDNMTCAALRWDKFEAAPSETQSLSPDPEAQEGLDVLAKVSYKNSEITL